jgi:hypothetical protein
VKASLFDPDHGMPSKRYCHLALCRCHSALNLGLAVRVYTLSPPLIVRPTAYRYNNVCSHFGYLCVRRLAFFLDCRDWFGHSRLDAPSAFPQKRRGWTLISGK